jgi:hypothetical protein
MAVSPCDDVPAFLETDDPLLRVEPVEFGVRRASAGELLQKLSALVTGNARRASTGLAARLVSRRKRLAAVRARLKERRAELQCERNRLNSERLQFEAERAEFNRQREAAALNPAGDAPTPFGRAVAAGANQPSPLAGSWDKDADRMKALFRRATRPSPEIPPMAAAPPVAAPLPPTDAKQNSANAAIADSVADYMDQLLGRMRSGRPGAPAAVEADEGPRERARAEAQSRPAPATREAAVGDIADAAPQTPQNPKRARPRPSVHEIRAGVGSLREIANHSARTAVARHTARKLRQSVAITLPLSIISFVLAGVLFFIGGIDAKFYSQAFGTVMLGMIVLIELAHSFWKMRNAHRARVSRTQQNGDDAVEAGTPDDAISPTPVIAEEPQDESAATV